MVTVVVPHFQHCGHRGATMVACGAKVVTVVPLWLSPWLPLFCHCCVTVVSPWCHFGFHFGHYKGHYGTGFEWRRLFLYPVYLSLWWFCGHCGANCGHCGCHCGCHHDTTVVATVVATVVPAVWSLLWYCGHFGATVVLLRCHSGPCGGSCVLYYGGHCAPLWCHRGATVVPPWCHHGAIWSL